MHSGQNWLLKYGNFFFFAILLFSLYNREVNKTMYFDFGWIYNKSANCKFDKNEKKITKTLKSYRRFWKTFFPAVLVISAFLIENKMIKINNAPQFSSCIDVDSYSCWLIFFLNEFEKLPIYPTLKTTFPWNLENSLKLSSILLLLDFF